MSKSLVSKKYKKQSKTRHSGVILERIEHKIDLLSESQTGMKEKLDATFEMVGELSEDMTMVKDDIKILRGDVSVLKKDVATMKGDMGSIKNELKRKVDVEKFAALEKRVTAV